jgi:hypothetical protein
VEEVAGKNIVAEGQVVEEVSLHTQLEGVEDFEEEAVVHTLGVVQREGADSKQVEVKELGVVSPSASLWQQGQTKIHRWTSLHGT